MSKASAALLSLVALATLVAAACVETPTTQQAAPRSPTAETLTVGPTASPRATSGAETTGTLAAAITPVPRKIEITVREQVGVTVVRASQGQAPTATNVSGSTPRATATWTATTVAASPTSKPPPPPSPTSAPASTSQDSACRSDPLANVYHPDRLKVIKPCLTISGTVMTVRHEADGDYHINVDLDPPFANLINDRNVSGEHGYLVTEIVPADETGCTPGHPPKPATGTYNYGTCTGTDLVPPSVGTHVAMTGPYVLDQAHGWMEIHPVWAWQTNSGSASTATVVVSTVAPVTPTLAAVSTAPSGATARCKDGTYSYSQHRSGTCSHHGGVAAWY